MSSFDDLVLSPSWVGGHGNLDPKTWGGWIIIFSSIQEISDDTTLEFGEGVASNFRQGFDLDMQLFL